MKSLQLCVAAAAVAIGMAALTPANAAGDKAVDCAKAENAKRSECAKAVGQSRENERTNKGAATTGADRSGAVQDMNAARDKKGGGKKN
jgi:hypothetical protein